ARFAMKPADDLGAAREVRKQHLHRDVAPELAVTCAKHGRHAALAELIAELVATERVTGANLAWPLASPAAAAGRRITRGQGGQVADGGLAIVTPVTPIRPVRRAPRHGQLADHTTWFVLPAALAAFIALPSLRPSSSGPLF